MLIKIVMGLLVLALGKNLLENRYGKFDGVSKRQKQSIFGNSVGWNESRNVDDYFEQEQQRLSNPYETPGVDINVDRDYHGMSTGSDFNNGNGY